MASKRTTACLDPQRRNDARSRGLNGIDYVEVNESQRVLAVHFFSEAPKDIIKESVQLAGGVRVRDLRVIDLRLGQDPGEENCLFVMVDKPGDYSAYTLRLVALDSKGQPTKQPLADFDPLCSEVEFSFKAGVPSDLDCKQQKVCALDEAPSPDINYLAKDYQSFRQLILDRMALTVPDWQEQHAPDVGIALVEILAYTGDYLSYYQDAVATEAYLSTARQRISIRRHVRLIDYTIHEGCNARTWVLVETTGNITSPPLDPQAIYFLAGAHKYEIAAVRSLADLANVPGGQYEVFLPVTTDPISLYQAHNQICFYTWGDRLCCLPAGATSATLRDEWEETRAPEARPYLPPPTRGKKSKAVPAAREAERPPEPAALVRKLHLRPGDVLFFEEVSGPNPDPDHRHFVRLTKVEQSVDPVGDQPVVEIEWEPEDALPFSLCLSQIGSPPDCDYVPDISFARGNVILVDNGSLVADEYLGTVLLETTPPGCAGIGRPRDIQTKSRKFQPVLKKAPLTFSQPIVRQAPAALALVQDPRRAAPRIRLTSIPPLPDGSGPLFGFADLENPAALAKKLASSKDAPARHLREQLSAKTLGLLGTGPEAPGHEKGLAALSNELKKLLRSWIPRRDLLDSGPKKFHFVVEMDNDGFAHLRFGDGVCGRAPEAGEAFIATYWIGNGPAGNIGAETISKVVSGMVSGGLLLTPRNPISASGGTTPESIEEVKLFAPGALQNRLQRAVTAADYARLAERNPRVQRAAAELVWTGARYEAHVAIDPLGTEQVDAKLLWQIHRDLLTYRRVGHDLVVVPAQYVPLDVAMTVDVAPDYFQAHVRKALLNVFSNRALPGGRKGFFHPDNLSFGDGIYLSGLMAAAQAVQGVRSVKLTKLERLFAGPNHELEDGILPIGPLEVARLDNDPNIPENGKLVLILRGGQ